MNILALDCSTSVLGIGVCRKGSQDPAPESRTRGPKHPYAASNGHSPIPGFVQLHIDAGYRHAERIIRGIEYCCEEAGIEPQALDLLACTGGPGSFTGLRIAASTIKGLALSLQKPHIFVSTLDAFAYAKEALAPVVVPLIDAKRGHFYFAVYQHGKRISGPFDAPLSAVLESVREADTVLFTGPDADLFEETAREHEEIGRASCRERV